MEPYSHRGGHGGHGSFPSKRGSFHDRTMSPTEPRSASIAFSKSSGGPPDFGSSRSRRFSTASNSSFVSSTDRDRPRDKDKKDGPPPSPHMPKGEIGLPKRPASLRGRDRESEKGKDFDRGRHVAMGPPPVPAHAWRNPSRESVRHRLSISGSVNGAAPPRRHPTDEPSEFQGPSSATRDPLHSPAPSHASLSTRGMLSPITPSLPLPGLGHDLEELKKDVMQSAAARAKQRRQQEEEEREAQKDRARRKAAELELKMKAEAEEKARKEEEVGQIEKELEQQAANEKVNLLFDHSQSLTCSRFVAYRMPKQPCLSRRHWTLEKKRGKMQAQHQNRCISDLCRNIPTIPYPPDDSPPRLGLLTVHRPLRLPRPGGEADLYLDNLTNLYLSNVRLLAPLHSCPRHHLLLLITFRH